MHPPSLDDQFSLVPPCRSYRPPASNYRSGRSEEAVGRALDALLAGSRNADYYRQQQQRVSSAGVNMQQQQQQQGMQQPPSPPYYLQLRAAQVGTALLPAPSLNLPSLPRGGR